MASDKKFVKINTYSAHAYSARLLAHFRQPRHAGLIDGPGVRTGSAGSRRRGTLVRFQVAIADDCIADAGYLVFGSPYAIAACSLAAGLIVGRIAEPEAVPPGRELAESLEFPVEQTAEALIVEDAIRAALSSPLSEGEA